MCDPGNIHGLLEKILGFINVPGFHDTTIGIHYIDLHFPGRVAEQPQVDRRLGRIGIKQDGFCRPQVIHHRYFHRISG